MPYLVAHSRASLSSGRGKLGTEDADFRIERVRTGRLRLRDGRLSSSADNKTAGLAVRVVYEGNWGFASGIIQTAAGVRALAEQAVAAARAIRAVLSLPVKPGAEPVYQDVTWISAYEVNPFDVPESERVERLAQLSRRLLASPGVDHVDASLTQVRENKFYADLAGTVTTQQRVRISPELTAIAVDRGRSSFASMRTLAPPAGRGWEYLTGSGWDFDAEIAEMPALLSEHAMAPSIEAGQYDVVIDPSNLWLTIHESIGHATELDRVLGYEAGFAGTSFACRDTLNSLRYGSAVMNVTGDRTTGHGLATVGYDDEGVAGQAFDIVRDGVLVGYQLNRQLAASGGFGRSNGCAFASSASGISLQRMANVSLQPQKHRCPPRISSLALTRAFTSRVTGPGRSTCSDSTSSSQASNFTGSRTASWPGRFVTSPIRQRPPSSGAIEAVGGPATYRLGGSFGCGKGQPGQSAPVSHGCPSALFRNINVLNAQNEGSR